MLLDLLLRRVAPVFFGNVTTPTWNGSEFGASRPDLCQHKQDSHFAANQGLEDVGSKGVEGRGAVEDTEKRLHRERPDVVIGNELAIL